MLARYAACACLMLGLAFAPAAQAQEVDRIAAVINDDIISLQELNGRIHMALVFSNIPDSADARRRVAPQVLRKMIDERLQMQEAARLKIALSASEVETGIAMIEQQNRMPKGALLGQLASQRVSTQLVKEQIKADLTWLRLTGRVLQAQVRVGDDEINDRLEMIKDRQGRPEYLAAEILLPVDSNAQEDDARKLGERLVEQVKSGAPFQALARQFSGAPTAGNGGSMGWLSEGVADDDILAVLEKLNKGEVSGLQRTAAGFAIYALMDRRIAGQTANSEDAQVVISQLVLPVPPNAPPKQELLGRAASLTGPSKSCAELEERGQRFGAPATKIGPSRVGELAPGLRQAIAQLPVNRASEPQDTAEGILIAMVCSRQETTKISLPSREQVRRLIEDERMDMMSRRYLRDLRRAAFIDVRG